jgi:DNA-binding response OmpR family regulator
MSTVLIVDDERDVCDLMRRVFERAGWTAVCLSDPTRAEATLRGVRIDVVLTDLMMPGLDGIGVVRAIRASQDTAVAQVPVVVYSAISDEVVVARAIAMGADDYLVKPTPVATIIERVTSAARGPRTGTAAAA